MNLEELVKIIENMYLQHDYPGFELRSLKLTLPQEANKCSHKIFAQALLHENVIVRLAAIRWFVNGPIGSIKQHKEAVLKCIQDKDEWVRLEALGLLADSGLSSEKVTDLLTALFQDQSVEVRRIAVKTAGKLGIDSPALINALKQTTSDNDGQVRAKAQKALRKLGAYES